VLSRSDDTLVVHGRNHFATDDVQAYAEVPGIRPRRVSAFAEGGDVQQRIRLLAEITVDADRSAIGLTRIARSAQFALAKKLELYICDFDLVEAGQLPVITSGTVRASEAERRHAVGAITLLKTDAPGG